MRVLPLFWGSGFLNVHVVNNLPQTLHLLNSPSSSVYGSEINSDHEYQELLAEGERLARLRHRNVIEFKGFCLDAATGRPKYIVTELARCSLREYLQQTYPVTTRCASLSEVLDFSRDILEGLVYLHSLRPYPMIHRDLKPENVLVVMTKNIPLLKLCDVGMSRYTTGYSSKMSMAGTPFYRAPEVTTGKYTTAVDMFSFGVMLAEMVLSYVYGRADLVDPVNRDPAIQSAVAALNRDFPALGDVLRSCCATDPLQRMTALVALSTLEQMGSRESRLPTRL